MIRVVLDTNVLVAALLTPTGNPAQLIEAVRNHQLLPAYSSAILTEYREVLFAQSLDSLRKRFKV